MKEDLENGHNDLLMRLDGDDVEGFLLPTQASQNFRQLHSGRSSLSAYEIPSTKDALKVLDIMQKDSCIANFARDL